MQEAHNRNIEKIAEILKTDKKNIPRGITIFLESGEGAGYSKEKRKIIYRFKTETELLVEKGKLIHEATHVVQDYPTGIYQNHSCWCWMEGIADYCRSKIDSEFQIENELTYNPESGYREAAYFLIWLSKEYNSIIEDLNLLIRNKAHELKNANHIFGILIKQDYNNLKREYIYSSMNNSA